MGYIINSTAVVVALFAVLLYYSPVPSGVTFTSYDIPEVAEQFTAPPNNVLDNAEKLFEDKVYGPEGLAVHNGNLYFSAQGGLVYELDKSSSLKKVLVLNDKCDEFWDEVNCGRPLGMKFDKGNLYLAAVNYGILKVNVTTGKFNVAIPGTGTLESKLPNSLDIASDGTIYYSESSTVNSLEDGFLILMADGNGRVQKYNPKSKLIETLLDGLVFANGVALSPDGNVLFVSETVRSRVHRVVVKGSDSGKHSVFIDKLPGYPDNIRINSKGNLLIAVIDPFYSDLNLMKWLAPRPYIRKFVYKLLYSITLLLDKVIESYPQTFFKRMRHSVAHIETSAWFSKNRVLIIEVDMAGNIVQVYASRDGSIGHICDMVEFNGYYYLGSPYNHYLARKAIS